MTAELNVLVFLSALAVAAFSPGPSLAAVVATVLGGGLRAAVWFCLGVIVGDLAWLLLSLGGLAVVVQQLPVLFYIIKWAGVAYLFYLAFKIWRSASMPSSHVSPEHSLGGVSIRAQLLSGFSVTMGNPKAMLFYLALIPNLIQPGQLSFSLLLLLMLCVVVVLAASFAVYILAAHRARMLLQSERALAKLNRITATALGGAALWIASR